MDNFNKVANLLRLVSDLIKDGDLKQIDETYVAIRQIRDKRKKGISGSAHSQEHSKYKSSSDRVELNLDILETFETRDEVEDFLEPFTQKRVDLERIARQLKLPLSKTEDAHGLVEKIIDATVGYKLRSRQWTHYALIQMRMAASLMAARKLSALRS